MLPASLVWRQLPRHCKAASLAPSVVTAGRMQVTHDDGSEVEIGPGDAYRIAPGRSARIVSDEPFVGFEFETSTVETYGEG
jgi:hypothetical protein